MKILKVEQPGHTSSSSGPVLRLETGQRLAAISLSDARPGDRAMLSVAGGQLQVTTQHPLKAGQAIDLIVSRLGEQVHLRPMQPPPDPRTLDEAQLTRHLLQSLSKLSHTSSASAAAGPAGGSTATAIPPGLQGLLPMLTALREPRMLHGVVSSLLASASHTSTPAKGTATSFSAPFMAAGAGPSDTPLGGLLQRAAQTLRTQPDLAPREPAARQQMLEFMQRLGNQVERSQISTALSQGAAGQAAGTQTTPTQPTWLLDIPVQLANEAHNLRMAIREEPEGGGQATPGGHWQVDLAMEWPNLGPLHAALNLRGERIDIDLFADQPATVHLIEASRPQLSRGLVAAGLTPGRVSAYPGPPPQPVQDRLEPQTQRPTQTGFLSEQA